MSNKDIFIFRGQTIFSRKFDYSLVEYKNVDSKVTIVCPIHGKFEQTPYHHLKSKYGCKKCGEKASAESKEKSTNDFITKARSVHGDTYDYSKTVYTKAKEKLEIVCPVHGVFEQLASGHLAGYGCFRCRNHGKGRVAMDQPCNLYYFNIIGTNLYKLGITSKSLEERYRAAFDRDQINLLFIREYSTGREAYNVEQFLLATYTHLRYQGNNILTSGNTELFTENILKGIN